MRKRLVASAVLAVAASLLSVVPATAADRIPLALTGFFDVALDDARGRLIITQGTGSTEVVVTDLGGFEITRLSGLADAMGVTFSEDGGSLWVALPTQQAVARFDAATLAPTGWFALPGDVCPGSVAETAGYLAVGHSCNQYAHFGGTGSVGVLDPATGAWNDLAAGPTYQPYVAASPGSPGLVVAGDLGLSPTTLYTIGIVDGIPDVVSSRRDTGSNLRDVAVAPDGTTVVQASGYPYRHDAFSLPGLADAGSYLSTNYPNAVAWSADGSTVVTGTDSPYNIDVRVHHANSPFAIAEYELSPHRLLPRGLAVTGDGSIVLAVSGSGVPGDYGLHVLPGFVTSTVEAVGTATATVGEPVTLTGRLSFADGASAADKTIEVTLSYADVAELVDVVITDPTGAFAVVDVPVVATPTTYTFRFAGEPPYGPASGETVVTVNKRVAELSISADAVGGKGKNRNDYVITARLGTTFDNRVVTISAVPEGGGAEVIAVGTVDGAGELTATYRLEATTTFVASFDGDPWYLPASAETTVVKKKGGKPRR